MEDSLGDLRSREMSLGSNQDFFVKLSTRSPKDSFLLPHRARVHERNGVHIDEAEQLAMRV
jgi:hypothetical protein